MRILHVTPAYYPAVRHGGPILAMREIDHALANLGAEIDVLTTNTHLQENLDVPLDSWVEDSGVRIRYMPRIGRSTYSLAPSQLTFLLREAAKYDAFCVTSLFNFAPIAFFLASLGRRLHYWVSPRAALNLGKRRLVKEVQLTFALRRLYRRAAFVHVTSAYEAETLEAVGLHGRVVMAPNAVSTVTTRLPQHIRQYDRHGISVEIGTAAFLQSLRSRRFFYFGTVSPLKGVASLIEAFVSSPLRVSASLVIVGPDYQSERERLLRRYGDFVGDDVHIIDHMDRSELLGIAPELGVSVHPSLGENFSNSLIEISQLGIPAIVSTEIGAREYVSGDGIVMFDPMRHGELSDALIHVMENYDGLRASARQRQVHLGSWRDSARILLDSISKGRLNDAVDRSERVGLVSAEASSRARVDVAPGSDPGAR